MQSYVFLLCTGPNGVIYLQVSVHFKFKFSFVNFLIEIWNLKFISTLYLLVPVFSNNFF